MKMWTSKNRRNAHEIKSDLDEKGFKIHHIIGGLDEYPVAETLQARSLVKSTVNMILQSYQVFLMRFLWII